MCEDHIADQPENRKNIRKVEKPIKVATNILNSQLNSNPHKFFLISLNNYSLIKIVVDSCRCSIPFRVMSTD